MRRWGAVLVGLVVGAAACATSPLLRAARSGDEAALAAQLDAAAREGRLTNAAVREVAAAVLERDLASAEGTAGEALVLGLRGCAPALRGALRDRAERPDDPGAAAELLLLEDGARPGDLTEEYAASPMGAWRAVAARAAVTDRGLVERSRFFTDADARVRRAAFAAAFVRPAEAELDALLAAARTDPDESNRRLALRALGALGGERVVLALTDLWARADATERVAVVDAWAALPSFVTGGERELLRVVGDGPSVPALDAAGALLREGDPAARAASAALVLRCLETCAAGEQATAIALAPVAEPAFSAALGELAAAPATGETARLAALERLVANPATRAQALERLKTLVAAGGDGGLGAELALARAGDRAVIPALTARLTGADAATQRRLADALIGLGEDVPVAPLLTAPDASLRASIACTLLAK